MLRVLDLNHPAAKVVLIQGTPDNQMVRSSTTAAPHSPGNNPTTRVTSWPTELLAAAGLDDVSSRRVGARLALDEPTADASARAAAGILASVRRRNPPGWPPPALDRRLPLWPPVRVEWAEAHS